MNVTYCELKTMLSIIYNNVPDIGKLSVVEQRIYNNMLQSLDKVLEDTDTNIYLSYLESLPTLISNNLIKDVQNAWYQPNKLTDELDIIARYYNVPEYIDMSRLYEYIMKHKNLF